MHRKPTLEPRPRNAGCLARAALLAVMCGVAAPALAVPLGGDAATGLPNAVSRKVSEAAAARDASHVRGAELDTISGLAGRIDALTSRLHALQERLEQQERRLVPALAPASDRGWSDKSEAEWRAYHQEQRERQIRNGGR